MFVNPVAVEKTQKKFTKPSALADKATLEKELKRRGHDVTLGEMLKGGFASQAYAATLAGEKVVVKHTEDLAPFDPTELLLGADSIQLDVEVLTNLQGHAHIRVPTLVDFLADCSTSIMRDVREDGYTLQVNQILADDAAFNVTAGAQLGTMLAHLQREAKTWEIKAPIVEPTLASIYERGLELRLAYPNTQNQYVALEEAFVANAEHLTMPDAHPKNVFINDAGETLLIDFGYSQYGDQRFILASALAHIALYSCGGHIKPGDAKRYIDEGVAAYKAAEGLFDEELFCRYFAMEVLHRSYGKWVDGIESTQQKLRCIEFGLSVFDQNIATVGRLLDLVSTVAQR